MAEQITDHTIGKGQPSTEISKMGGNPNIPVIHIPIYAPVNPNNNGYKASGKVVACK